MSVGQTQAKTHTKFCYRLYLAPVFQKVISFGNRVITNVKIKVIRVCPNPRRIWYPYNQTHMCTGRKPNEDGGKDWDRASTCHKCQKLPMNSHKTRKKSTNTCFLWLQANNLASIPSSSTQSLWHFITAAPANQHIPFSIILYFLFLQVQIYKSVEPGKEGI